MHHQLQIRVYYEDTDFSGRVYHASYLRFMERGRTEWLRASGFENGALSSGLGLVFVVRSLRIDFLAPALMDDIVMVETRVASSRGAIIEFEQVLSRAETILSNATVRVVTLRGSRPVRPPRELVAHREAS